MKVPRPLGSGKVIAKAKGVCREAESEGRRRQNSSPTYKNHVRPQARVRLPDKPKSKSCTESLAVNMAGIRRKECVSTRGGLTDKSDGREAETGNSSEQSVLNRSNNEQVLADGKPKKRTVQTCWSISWTGTT